MKVKYQYTVINRNDREQHGLDSRFWANHPEWNVFVRTSVRHPDRGDVWLSGGGATLAEALASAEVAIHHYVLASRVRMVGGVALVGSVERLEGEASPSPIMNQAPVTASHFA